MFIGRYYHSLEPKGRLAIPKVFRTQLKSGGVITAGLDGCLYLFPASSWKKLSAKLASLPLTNKAARNFIRLLVGAASTLDLDSQGRTLIPEHLRGQAKLTKKVVVAGSLSHIEIWDQTSYHQHLDKLELTNQMEEELTALGI